jgi:large conductance mechanosensitive channel
MGFLSELREFAVKGSVVDMAVGIMIGAAFAGVVTSFSNDILMPPVGLLVGDDDLSDRHFVLRDGDPGPPYADPAGAKAAGAVTLNYGRFIEVSIAFVITATVLFVLVRTINRIRRDEEDPNKPSTPSRKSCLYCTSSIPAAASRCPQCTSDLT